MKLWNSVEVHAIYEFVYSLCTSEEGVQQFRNYFSAEDPKVFDPLFIAQYLLIPVNTIVKQCLKPWMMETYYPRANKSAVFKKSEKLCGRERKVELFLKFSILVDLMQIVKKYGRNCDYNFLTDEKLALIRFGIHSDQWKNDSITKITLSIDSFMTIWLLTLPEKFKDWYEHHDDSTYTPVDETPVMSFTERPTFPPFMTTQHHTGISGNIDTGTYQILPKTWNLMQCFEYYLQQQEKWSTISSEAEWNASLNMNFEGKMSKGETKPLPNFGDHQDENKNEEAEAVADDKSEDVDEEETDDESEIAVAIKTSSDNENDEIQLARAIPRKRSSSNTSIHKSVKKTKKKKRKLAETTPMSPETATGWILKMNQYMGKVMYQMDCLKERLKDAKAESIYYHLLHNMNQVNEIRFKLNEFTTPYLKR